MVAAGLARLRSRLLKPKGQTMTEYALVIAGVAVVVLFGGYIQMGTIMNNLVNSVLNLFSG